MYRKSRLSFSKKTACTLTAFTQIQNRIIYIGTTVQFILNLNVCVPKYELLNTCILWVVSVLEKICQNYDIAVESLNWVIDNSMLTITDSTLILNLHLYHRTFGAFSLVAFFFFFPQHSSISFSCRIYLFFKLIHLNWGISMVLYLF